MNKSIIFFVIFLFSITPFFSQQLMINEVSQGSGSSEYVEFVVVGSPICEGEPIPCIDIRKVIFDDNNGYFATGTGTGIAPGALRFSNSSFWSCIPQGTIIIIYNENEINTSISSLTLLDSLNNDGNCRLILPANSSLLETTAISPNNSDPLYPQDSDWVVSLGWSSGNGPIGIMSNTNDSFQIPNLGQNGTPLHSVSWGNNTNGTIIYFPGPVSNQVINFKNIISNDFNDQQNWTSEDVATAQTPGLPNSPENSYWIGTMNPTCRAIPVITISATNTSACGTETGSASVNTDAIVGASQIVWNNGLTSSTISNLDAGVYSVTVTDELGCTFEESIAVNDQGGPTVVASIKGETCLNSCDGNINLVITGGLAPYEIAWSSNVLLTQNDSLDAFNLCSDEYTAIVTDANACKTSIIEELGATQNLELIVTSTQATCGNATATATATVLGGFGNYAYQWSVSAGNQTTQTAVNLPSGVHQLTVTDLSTNCQITEQFLISDEGGLQTSVLKTPTSCKNRCDASATISVSGGSGTYTYTWDVAAASQTSPTASNLCAGNYTCIVADNAGCSRTLTLTIINPDSVGFTNQITTTSCPNICDGELVISPFGGLAPYQISIYDMTGNIVNATNLCAGLYVVTVTDAVACESTPKKLAVLSANTIDYTKSSNQTVCLNEVSTINVFVLSSGAVLTWDDGSTDEIKNITPTTNTNYPFEIVLGSCSIKDTIKITVIDCTEDSSVVSLPNIFTPDGDSKNDVYVPLILKNVTVTSFVIVNRWGNIMVEFNDNNIFWDGKIDGKDAHDGTYFYILNYKDIKATDVQLHGFIQLIRK